MLLHTFFNVKHHYWDNYINFAKNMIYYVYEEFYIYYHFDNLFSFM